MGSFFVLNSKEQLITPGAGRKYVLPSQCPGSTSAATEAAWHMVLGQPGVTYWCLLTCSQRCSSAIHPQPSLHAAQCSLPPISMAVIQGWGPGQRGLTRR